MAKIKLNTRDRSTADPSTNDIGWVDNLAFNGKNASHVNGIPTSHYTILRQVDVDHDKQAYISTMVPRQNYVTSNLALRVTTFGLTEAADVGVIIDELKHETNTRIVDIQFSVQFVVGEICLGLDEYGNRLINRAPSWINTEPNYQCLTLRTFLPPKSDTTTHIAVLRFEPNTIAYLYTGLVDAYSIDE